MSEQVAVNKVAADAASTAQLVKLLLFSLSLGIVPIASYFGSLEYVWNGNATYAALTAVVGANIVLVGYIISSVLDDKRETSSPTKETKKTQ
ncbi:hypothetical protein FB45DRAFT_1054956 [Roridomyces roridus]|uniref:Vacuolar ATPase assembly integral membrane protein VMA21 n=1 Tax=Roridomyces roridus TaxID=1738132 RepID=A0AAD7C6A9_9AGAR|nr:hypothetical protein FB45DRAFT_1054956 [Roridomyces roridus]